MAASWRPGPAFARFTGPRRVLYARANGGFSALLQWLSEPGRCRVDFVEDASAVPGWVAPDVKLPGLSLGAGVWGGAEGGITKTLLGGPACWARWRCSGLRLLIVFSGDFAVGWEGVG